MLTLLDNPITQAELTHQRQFSSRPRGFRYVIRFLYGLPLTISLFLFFIALLGAVTGHDFRQSGQSLGLLLAFLFVATVIAHFGAILQTLVLSSDAINREKRGGTWDTLLITRVDARQLVVGKWWATVRHMWPSFLAAGALRLGPIIWIGIEIRQFTSTYSIYSSQVYLTPGNILLAAGAVLLLSIVNTGVTAAFGILASLLTHRSGHALVLAVMLRTFVLLFLMGGLLMSAFVVHLLLSSNRSLWSADAAITSLLEISSVTVADNGSLLAATMAASTASQPLGDIGYVIYILIPLGLYLLLTWVLLWIAQRVAVRQGVCQPTRYKPPTQEEKETDALPVPE